MKHTTLVVVVAAVLACSLVSAGAADTDDACPSSAELRFDDIPKRSLGDLKAAAKVKAGMNPLTVKFLRIDTSPDTINLQIRTHDSFAKYWKYSETRNDLGAPIRTEGSSSTAPKRGYVLQLLATTAARPEKVVRGYVWIDYASPTSFTPACKFQVEPGFSGGFAPPIPRWLDPAALQADIAGPVNIVMGLNEMELRIPTGFYGFRAGDEVTFRFWRGDATVCLPAK